MNKILLIISALTMLTVGLTSCGDDDDVYRNEIGSHVKEGHSIFYIQNQYLNLAYGDSYIIVNLKPVRGAQEFSVVASVFPGAVHHIVQIPLQEIGDIPNGVYTMMCETLDGMKKSSKLNVNFRDNMLHSINYVMAEYPMERGNGTVDAPYEISSAEDFDLFKYTLKGDSEKGRGQYFKQTASFEALNDIGDTDRGYGCEDFAGNYDGGGFTIKYGFYGSGQDSIDSNRGMFATLRDGAVVSNLNIKASLTGTRYNAGALAGSAMGNVGITNVYYHTEITSQSGNDNAMNVGGLIGKVENATLAISSAGTLNDVINVSGKNCVGGLIGCVVNSSFNIDDIKIVHDISSANADVSPVYSSNDYAGGIIGRIESTNNSCFINDCEVKTAIKAAGNYAGGLVGGVVDSHTFSVTDCTVGSYVKGGKHIGGFVGIFSGSGRLQLSGANVVKNKQILGVGTIGGVIGKLVDTNISLSGNIKVDLGVDAVVGTHNVVGGFIGEIVDTDVDIAYNEIEFSDATKVSGNMCVGGLVGMITNSILSSSANVSFSSSIPEKVSHNYMLNTNVDGKSRVGGAVGHSVNSSINGFAIKANVTGIDSIGGIVGSAELSTTACLIEDCVFDGSVKAAGKDIGGVCGKFTKDGKIYYCINYGSVQGNENVGGIAGAANYGNITGGRTFFDYCVNVGSVTGSKDVAGIVGYLHGDDDYYIHVINCANYGTIEGSSSTTGGIVGLIPTTKGRIYYSVNHGSVYSSNACRTGGIIGKMGKDADALNQSTNLEIGWCANIGKVSCSGDSDVGGIVGYAEEGAVDWKDQDSWVHDCYNTGTISEGGGNAGGIIGYSDRYCYLLRLVNYGVTDYAIVGDYKYGPDLYDDYTYYTNGKQTDYIADTYVGDNPGDQGEYGGFDFASTWQISGGKAILQETKCPFQNKAYNP